MTPLRSLLPAARERIERRKTLIGGLRFSAGMIVGSVAGQAFIDPPLEPIAEAVRAMTIGERRIETFRANPLNISRLYTHGGPEQRATLEAVQKGEMIPRFAMDRVTYTYVGPDGSQWVDWQGRVASGLLGWGEHPRKLPMHAQPDRAFGAWSGKRLEGWRKEREPVFVRIRGDVAGEFGVDEQDYSILGIPLSEGRVVTVSATWPGKPAATPQRDPTTHSRASEGQGLARFASI